MPIESGRTRCPRCMAFSEYRFVDRGDNTIEYEVRCESCGNVHSEITAMSAAVTTAA